MIFQCWFMQETGQGVCVYMAEYDGGTGCRKVIQDAIAQALAIQPGVYVVTKPGKTSGGSPFVEQAMCFTMHSDHTFTDGPETSLPRLVSWPPKKPRSKE